MAVTHQGKITNFFLVLSKAKNISSVELLSNLLLT
jgi:hypothetical protein